MERSVFSEFERIRYEVARADVLASVVEEFAAVSLAGESGPALALGSGVLVWLGSFDAVLASGGESVLHRETVVDASDHFQEAAWDV